MPLYHSAYPCKHERIIKTEEKRIGGSVLRFEFCGFSFGRKKKLVRNGGVETYIAVTLSKTVDRTCHFIIQRIHASMNASLKSKRNDSGERSVLRFEFCGFSFGRKTFYMILMAGTIRYSIS